MSSQNLIDKSIDLNILFKKIVHQRNVLYYFITGSVICGLLFYAMLSPKFESRAVLVPSAEKKGGLGNLAGMGALAGLAGINLSSLTNDLNSGISADLYPEVVGSYDFLKKVITEKYKFTGISEPITILDYANLPVKKNFAYYVKFYTVGWFLKLFHRNSVSPNIEEHNGSITWKKISKEEANAFMFMENRITIQVDKVTALIYIKVTMPEGILAAQVGSVVIDKLQAFLIEHKTKQIQNSLDYLNKRFEEKRLDLENSQKRLFDFRDSHRNMVIERTGFEYQHLQDEYDIDLSIYKSLIQQREQTLLQLKMESPSFSILSPFFEPDHKHFPKLLPFLIISFLLGLLLGTLFIFADFEKKFTFIKSLVIN